MNVFSRINENSVLKRVLMTLAAAIVIVWFYPHPGTHKFIYEQGRPWNYNQLIAPFDIPIHPTPSPSGPYATPSTPASYPYTGCSPWSSIR